MRIGIGLSITNVLTRGSGGGASGNLYFTDDAYSNAYYTDDAKVNKYVTNGGGGAFDFSRGNTQPIVDQGALSKPGFWKTTGLYSHTSKAFVNNTSTTLETVVVVYSNFGWSSSLEFTPASILSVRASCDDGTTRVLGKVAENTNLNDASIAGADHKLIVFTGLNIAAGGTFTIRTRCAADIAQIPGTYPGYVGSDSGDYTMGGTPPANTSNGGYGPYAVLGFHSSFSSKSVAIYGDSQDFGFNNTVKPHGVQGVELAGRRTLNLAVVGQTLNNQASASARRIGLAKAARLTHALIGFPTNDVIGNRTVAQIQASYATFWAALKAQGFEIIQLTGCTRVVDGSFPGTIFPTPAGAFGDTTSRAYQVVNWINSVPSPVDYVYDRYTFVCEDVNTGLYRNGYVQADGLHYSDLAHNATGAEFGAYLIANSVLD